MTLDQKLDALITMIAGYDRRQCLDELRRIRRPRLDFTDDYLGKQNIERLRHIVLAARLQSRRRA